MSEEKKSLCCSNENFVKQVKDNILPDELLYDLAEFFKVFGDSTRIKIINALFTNEMCVGDIALMLDVSQSAVSHQLRVLKQSGVVKYRREGKMIYYSLDDDHIKDIFNIGVTHLNE